MTHDPTTSRNLNDIFPAPCCLWPLHPSLHHSLRYRLPSPSLITPLQHPLPSHPPIGPQSSSHIKVAFFVVWILISIHPSIYTSSFTSPPDPWLLSFTILYTDAKIPRLHAFLHFYFVSATRCSIDPSHISFSFLLLLPPLPLLLRPHVRRTTDLRISSIPPSLSSLFFLHDSRTIHCLSNNNTISHISNFVFYPIHPHHDDYNSFPIFVSFSSILSYTYTTTSNSNPIVVLFIAHRP